MSHSTRDGWAELQEYGTDFEADILRDRLDDAGIPAVVLSQRDHAHSLNVGTISSVKVMVRPEDFEAAQALMDDVDPVTDEELTEAALAAEHPDTAEDARRMAAEEARTRDEDGTQD